MNIGNMDLNYRGLKRAYAVLERYACMSICTGIQNYAVTTESHFLQLVYQFAFNIALIVVNHRIGIVRTKCFQIRLHSV